MLVRVDTTRFRTRSKIRPLLVSLPANDRKHGRVVRTPEKSVNSIGDGKFIIGKCFLSNLRACCIASYTIDGLRDIMSTSRLVLNPLVYRKSNSLGDMSFTL